ncbi:hypothetical protein EXIGLDRAFT_645578 [Exidia glandulosa HHB12029]|uniref:P-loop containing nucleoside triphosphate hydrolase protein n=1 Tax=Exidia glandulosa HHB12029 TaxID=1314781 RepID=A0A165IWL3_EXIGL|nr:hypothetical protein EXIGLDRAFT_645578 [Exidia glandulosa HHB12029]
MHPGLSLIAVLVILQMPKRVTSSQPTKNAEGVLPALDDWASLGQWSTFSWLTPLIAVGTTGVLEEHDIWQLPRALRSRLVFRKFQYFAREKSLVARLLLANARELIIIAVLAVCATCLELAQPVLLSKILLAMERRARTGRRDRQAAYLWTILAFLAMMSKAEIELQWFYKSSTISIRGRAETIATIYAKALKRIDTSGVVNSTKDDGSESTAGSADMGKITSLVTTDAAKVGWFAGFYTNFFQTPLAVVLAASFLYSIMGLSAFAGYIALLFAIPANYLLLKVQYKVYQGAMDMRDRRMRSMNEFVKLSGWESRWADRILTYRERELSALKKQKIVEFMQAFLWDVVPIFVACISLTTFTYIAGNELSVSIAFPALLTFQILTDELTGLPWVIDLMQKIYASVNRIDDFLQEVEVPAWVCTLLRDEQGHTTAFDDRVGFEDATFVWNTSAITPEKRLADELKKKADEEKKANRRSWVDIVTFRKRTVVPSTSVATEDTPAVTPKQEFTLRDMSVIFPRGKISLIYGATGAGKSSLLSALLGELKCVEGRVYLPKFSTRTDSETGLKESVSFCAQQPWLQHASIRDNILFGAEYDAERYSAVLSACALVADLNVLDDGDKTEIGEKGITLSGGQKGRVALARAVYAYTKTVILDDVLSAVDTHTADTIVKRCFLGPLMTGRTLILVTHHVSSVIQHSGYVVQMDNGHITLQGSPQELRARGELLEHDFGDKEQKAAPHEGEPLASKEGGEEKAVAQLVQKETKSTGAVERKIYVTYLKAAGYWIVIFLALTIALQRSSDLLQKLWAKAWSESYESYQNTDNPKTPFGFPSATKNPLPYVGVYIGIQSFNAIATVAAQIPDIWSSLRASRRLYSSMLHSVLRSPLRWFDKTPAGRILNRFGQDMDSVDSGISSFVRSVGEQLITFTISIVTIVVGVPPFLLAAICLGYVHYAFARGYVETTRDLNRIQSILRSPIVSTFGELLVGIETVRAFGNEMLFIRTLFDRLDKSHAANYYSGMVNHWLYFRFSALGALTFLLTAGLAVTLGVDPGIAAIVITQAQGVLGAIFFGTRAYLNVQQTFNGIERIAEYIDLPPEPPRLSNTPPPANWPSHESGIEFNNVAIKYAPELDPVLKNVSFEIQPREKIGLVGRTGSGKSTMVLSLFRFVDPAEGSIIIDGVDITSIGVDELRSRLTLIPQDAALFEGTIRENLDPFNEYTDAECLEVLRAVHLAVDTPVEAPDTTAASGTVTPEGESGPKVVTLESLVSESGKNWSAGQRQLIAMARALLRKTRITVLDESTASVDFETDKKIQSTIREGFNDGIMVIIAHRHVALLRASTDGSSLHTIIECDRVVVLDAGHVVEFDTPAKLMDKEGGAFRGMCQKSDHFESLYKAAHRG